MGVAKMQERDEAGSGHVARSCDTCMVAHVNVVSSPLEIRTSEALMRKVALRFARYVRSSSLCGKCSDRTSVIVQIKRSFFGATVADCKEWVCV